MPDVIEYVLQTGGNITRRDITERNISVSESVIAQLTAVTVTQVRNAFECRGIDNDEIVTPISLVTRGKEVYACFPLKQLTIRAAFRLTNGILMPMFSSQSDPVMPMVWTVPNNMRLRVLLQINCEGLPPARATGLTMWMYAFDANGYAYRLPLPNLYDDCKVCTGTQSRNWMPTIQKAIEVFMATFRSSTWNADLWTTVEQSQSLFQFKPEGDGFKAIPLENWVNQSRKVATAFSAMIPLL